MQVKGLSDVFVASGVETVDAETFTALFYGYEVRGKVRLPSAPTVEFFFYANVYMESREQAMDFMKEYEEKFGHARIRITEKYISVLLDIGGMEAPQVKERLGMIGNFMITNGFGAIALQPEEPEPEPEPPAPPQPTQQQRPQPTARGGLRPGQQPPTQRPGQPPTQRPGQSPTQRPGQTMRGQPRPKPPVEELKIPFEEYKSVAKLVQIFVNGVNVTALNRFTTLYHGYNLAGKLLHPIKEDVEIIFYGQLMDNVSEEFEKLRAEMNQKYGKVPMRMIGGSCDIILYLDGKDPVVAKEMLGCVSGFMMKNNIAAINLPNTVGATITTYTAENYKAPNRPSGRAPMSQPGATRPGPAAPQPMGRTYPSGQQAPAQQGGGDDSNSFAKNFLKKFSKNP